MKKKALLYVVALTFALTFVVALSLALSTAYFAKTKTYPIPEDLTVNVQIFDGATLLGTVTKDTLGELTQERISMTTTNDYQTTTTSVYVAYNVKAAADKLGIVLPASITSVHAFASDDYDSVYTITTLDNAYISIGFDDDGVFGADEKGPRFISDKTSASSNSVAKYIAKIVINPVIDNEDDNGDNDDDDNDGVAVLAFTLTPTWSDGGRTLSIAFTDVLSSKNNTIVLSTPEGESVVTSLTIDDKEPVALTENLLISYEKSGTTFLGYKLDGIIANMGKYKSGGTWFPFVADYTTVRFACTDDAAETDYSARAYTKAEVDGETAIMIVFDAAATGEEGKTRVYSSLLDTDPATYRNKLKKVSVVNIFAITEEE